MNESDNLEGMQGEERTENTYGDPYTSESSADIYATPDVTAAPEIIETEVVDTHGLFSGSQQETNYQVNDSSNPAYPGNSAYPSAGTGYGGQSYYGNQPGGYGMQPPYGNQPGGYGMQSPYGNQPGGYGMQPPYGNQQDAGYGVQPPYGDQSGMSYESQQDSGYGGQAYYGNQPGNYGMQPPYGSQPGGYGVQPPYGDQSGMSYGSQQDAGYGGQSYYESRQGMGYGQPPYGNQPGGYGGQPPYGNQPPYNNPYSPYAMPQKGKHTGLIIGIVVVIIILFLVAVFALASRAVDMLSEKEKDEFRRDVYNFDDAFDFDDDYDHDDYDDHDDYFHNGHDYGFDFDDDYDYNDYFDDGYDGTDYDKEKYYTIHSDIKYDLSYQVDMEYYEYELDEENDNFLLIGSYPVISGDEVPNLDKLNKAVRKELDLVTDLFEKDYKKHVLEDEEAYFMATLSGYVTYMDEDKMSVIYQEEFFNDMGGGVYLISVNVDMKNGVVLDNKEILKIDDAFSIDFRERSDEQNGEISYLNYMTDQEITGYFNSDDVIVFYTPKGMEIGFNYDDGYAWVTVTYEEYEEYLKVF